MPSLNGRFQAIGRLQANALYVSLVALAFGRLIIAAGPDLEPRIRHVGTWSVPRTESVLLLDTSPFTLEYVKSIEYGGPEKPSEKYTSYDLYLTLLFTDGEVHCSIRDVNEIKNLDDRLQQRKKRRVRFPLSECNGHPAMELFPDTDMAIDGFAKFTKTIFFPPLHDNVVLTIGPMNGTEQMEIQFKDEQGVRVFCKYTLEPSVCLGTPWVSLCDIDADGIDEILVGQGNYGRWDLQIFSAKSDNLGNLQNILDRLRGLENIPQDRILSLKGKNVVWDLRKPAKGAPFPFFGSPK